jgi:hypothetical protein
LDGECSEVIKSVWNVEEGEEISLPEVQLRLQQCGKRLIEWSSHKYGAVGSTIKSLNRRLEQLQKVENSRNTVEIKQVQTDIKHLLEMEDLKWK